ncbi:unnamed protein product [Rhizophagus irregularis]|uniref:Uncharacterized protein n=1 Tax=Rhizophagus irregularis TaxID=588596 RepID=A0A2I1GEF5_9GLOM|nr:hypothetical protein RhiirA4_400566 [Rhizophagus irregularis]CAB4443045.1 unnamed protein product [Rhizophagus irregularis]
MASSNIQNPNQISITSTPTPLTQEEEIRQISSNTIMTDHSSENSSRDVRFPTIPQRAFTRIRTTTTSPTTSPTEYLPTYSIVIRDMPPIYPSDQNDLDESSSQRAGLSREGAYIESLINLEAPILPQGYWPITKKFYVYGFIIWPLWLIGAFYIFLGDEYKTLDQEQGTNTNEENANNNNNNNNNNKFNTERLKWANRCLFNLLIITTLVAYVVVAYTKTKGNLT